MRILKVVEFITEILVVACLLGIVVAVKLYSTDTIDKVQTIALIITFFVSALLNVAGYCLAEKEVDKRLNKLWE